MGVDVVGAPWPATMSNGRMASWRIGLGVAQSGIPDSMRNKELLIGAVVLLLIGAAGIAVALGLSANNSVGPVGAPFPSNGQRIYYTGADATGPIPRTIAGRGMTGFGMMGNIACVDCHGEDGRGGRVGMMFGTIDIPDIRYLTLTTARSDNGTSIPAWTDSDITHAISDGVEPNGHALKARMPRWSMSEADVADVSTYMKELANS